MINDSCNNNHYSEIFDAGYHATRGQKKGKSKFGTLKKMTRNAARLASALASDGFLLNRKALEKSVNETEITTLVPLVSGAHNPEDYGLDQLEYRREVIKNTKSGKHIEFSSSGAMKSLIQNGQNSLEESGGSFSTYSFKGWKIKFDGFFQADDEAVHLLAVTQDGNWILEASLEQIFSFSKENGIESIGLTIELGSLHPITQGADASWNNEDRSLQLENRLYKKINVDKDYEDWENQFEAKNPDVVQIKKEIILNNFEERISIHKPIYTFKWIEGKSDDKDESDKEDDKEENDSDECEYVLEELPRETATFGSSRPMPDNILHGKIYTK